jgi:hypothetical protein
MPAQPKTVKTTLLQTALVLLSAWFFCSPASADSYSEAVIKADELLRANKFEEAFTQAGQAIQIDGSLFEAYFVGGLALYKMDSADLAESYLQKALARAPQEQQAHIQQVLALLQDKKQFNQHVLAAQKAAQDGLRGKAAREYEAAWRKLPVKADIGMQAAQLYVELGNWIQAAGILSAIAADPDNLADAAKARDQLNKIQYQAEPAYQIELQKVRTLQAQKQSSEAAVAARALIDLWPARAEGLFELARALSAQNSVDAAREALKKAIRYGTVNLRDLFNEPEFAALLNDPQTSDLLNDAFGAAAVTQANDAMKSARAALEQQRLQKERAAQEQKDLETRQEEAYRKTQEAKKVKAEADQAKARNYFQRFVGEWQPQANFPHNSGEKVLIQTNASTGSVKLWVDSAGSLAGSGKIHFDVVERFGVGKYTRVVFDCEVSGVTVTGNGDTGGDEAYIAATHAIRLEGTFRIEMRYKYGLVLDSEHTDNSSGSSIRVWIRELANPDTLCFQGDFYILGGEDKLMTLKKVQ